jgi:ammonium transporter, Amt family
LAGLACFWACIHIKPRFGYDDSLDVFGVHGVGGALGTLLTGVFAAGAISAGPEAPGGFPGLLEGNPRQLLIQLIGVLVTIAWSGLATFGLLKVIGWFTALRVSREAELMGLDISLHGEALQ